MDSGSGKRRKNEIGSIYEIDPASVRPEGAEDVKEPFLAQTAKYGRKNCVYTASCREAIALALRSLGPQSPGWPKRSLWPAYMGYRVFSPLGRHGGELHFYHVNRALEAEEGELRRRMEQVRPDLLFIHPYYGVDTWKPMRSLLASWREQGICIMEDVTQSYYLDGAGAEADYIVGSLRKWYPVPDGGFVVSDLGLWEGTLEDAEDYAGIRLEIQMGKWEYLYGLGNAEEEREKKAEYLKRNREMEEELDCYAGGRGMSKETAWILGGADPKTDCNTDQKGERKTEETAKLRRMDNYAFLDQRLRGNTQFVPVLDYAEGAAPLYFPIYAKDRDGLQHFLGARGIYAPVLWLTGKENADCLSEDERYIFGHLLALPMDQRYGKEEMGRIVEVLEEYESRTGAGALRDGASVRAECGQLVGIRADANATVATGHIMRCITIARQVKQMGGRVLFFTADEYAVGLLEQAGMEHVCLHTQWDRMEGEIPQLRKELEQAGCRKLFVDSYRADAAYFAGLADLCRLAYIDDCFEDVYPVNLLINYNAYHVRFPYAETYGQRYGGKTRLLLGTSYVPLRQEFWKQGDVETPEIQETEDGAPFHVLLSSGGGDRCDALAGILEEAVKDGELSQAVFHVVIGKFHSRAGELEDLAGRYPGILLHREVSDMAGLMRRCAAAVSAAGTMLFELSAMQVPSVFFVSADNQQYDSSFFAQGERMLFAGDIRADRQGCIGNILKNLKKLRTDTGLRQRMKAALRQVTDGRGAQRIAQAILEL